MRFVKYFGKQHFINGSIIKTKDSKYLIVIERKDFYNSLDSSTYKCIPFNHEKPEEAIRLNSWFRENPLKHVKDYEVITIDSSDIEYYTNVKIDEKLVEDFYNERYHIKRPRWPYKTY